MMIDRNSFIKYWLDRDYHDIEEGSPLWIPEEQCKNPVKCQWFLLIKSKEIETISNTDFGIWCNENLEGDVRCFSWGMDGIWFGFTLKSDIFLFKLRWAC